MTFIPVLIYETLQKTPLSVDYSEQYRVTGEKSSLYFLLVKIIHIGEIVLSGSISFYLDVGGMSFVDVFGHK